MKGVTCLVDELLCAVMDAVGESLKHSPRFRRKDLIDGRLVHERLLVLEESDDVVDEFTRVVRRWVVETTDSLLEQDATDHCDQLHNRNSEKQSYCMTFRLLVVSLPR